MHHPRRRKLAGLFAVVLLIGLAAGAVTAVGCAEWISAGQRSASASLESAGVWTVGHPDLTVFSLLGIAMACAAGYAALFSK